MMHLEQNANEKLIRTSTKPSKENKVSKFRLKQIPLVNDFGITEGYTNDNNYRFLESQLFHDILSCYFINNTQQEVNEKNEIIIHSLKYLIIGNQCETMFSQMNDEERKHCQTISREFFLELIRSNLMMRLNSNDN